MGSPKCEKQSGRRKIFNDGFRHRLPLRGCFCLFFLIQPFAASVGSERIRTPEKSIVSRGSDGGGRGEI